MILISHRGNLNGKNESLENNPNYIDNAISKGYDVEIDIWYKDGLLWLGHDEPKYKITIDFIKERISKLWIHCKNVEAIQYFMNHKDVGQYCHYFWHQNDDYTLTSHGFIWTFPDKKLSISRNTICVLPELGYSGNFNKCYGICTDFISNYTLL